MADERYLRQTLLAYAEPETASGRDALDQTVADLAEHIDEAVAVALVEQQDRVRQTFAHIGHHKSAQRELMKLGVDFADAGRILSRATQDYIDLISGALESSSLPPGQEDAGHANHSSAPTTEGKL